MDDQQHRTPGAALFPRRLGVLLATLVCTTLPIAACSSTDEQQASPANGLSATGDAAAGTADSTAAGSNTGTIEVAAPKLTVLNDGEGQRYLLRFDVPTTATPTSADAPIRRGASVIFGFTQEVTGEQPDPAPVAPADTVTASLLLLGSHRDQTDSVHTPTVGNGTGVPRGEIHTSYEVAQPTISDNPLNESMVTGDGFIIDAWQKPNGAVTHLSFTAPAGADDTARALIEDQAYSLFGIQPVFPEQPVGVGAQWKVASPKLGDASQLQTVTYTVEAINPTGPGGAPVVDLTVTIDAHPALKEIALREVEPGVAGTLHVLSATTTASGTARVDLAEPLPTTWYSDTLTRVIYGPNPDVETSGQQQVVQDTHTIVSMEQPKP
ncbi:hypothetical protein ACFPVT_07410 [Corynebacterium choanae]|uniref:Uncharacterized protein n=1 Tax=Corynebacterium choanae TaxID=1862358 RepID=A0A3G6J7G0_9CORY|nr:hypothetical protein [Corynebacterium choanae]AZA13926.1 hypothetical protein CCHOA_07670 [Corynebacterium choanae]